MVSKDILINNLQEENENLKSNLGKLIKKIDSIMANENNNGDIYELGIMISEIKTNFFNKN